MDQRPVEPWPVQNAAHNTTVTRSEEPERTSAQHMLGADRPTRYL